jgi:ribosomal protein S18 acetylase RimI-like enzyme
MIRFSNLTDNINEIARLIFQTDDIMPFLFGRQEKAVLKLKNLIENLDTVFSHKNIIIYQKDTQAIAGILLFYSIKNIDKKRENKAYGRIFSTSELFSLWLKSLILKSIHEKSEVDGLYIQNISVDAAARGEGIGTKLMNFVQEHALQKGYSSLWLDVAFTNPKAKKLYEREGFIEVSKHPILFSKNGFFRMRKNLLEIQRMQQV